MGKRPPLKGNQIMQFSPADEAEYLEQENIKANVELAAHPQEETPVTAISKIKPVAEVAKIIEMKDRIAAYMAPELEADLKAVAASSQVITKVSTKEERDAAQVHATACQKARTQKVEAPHTEFKAPVTAVGRLFDNRKTALSAIVKVEEDRVRGLIAGFDKIEAERIAEEDRQRKAKISLRINELASKGIAVDTEFAEVATDGEWALHVEKEVAAKEKADLEERLKKERAEAAQKRLLDRFEIASKLGAVISKDDAELLDDNAFEEMRDKWVIAFNQREAEAAVAREEADLVARAAAAGLALPAVDIAKMREVVTAGQVQDIEAAFMIWVADATQAKKLDDEKKAATARLAARMEEAEALGMTVAISVIKGATEEEWGAIVEAAKPAPVVATPKIPDHASIVTPAPRHTPVASEPAKLCTTELVAAVDAAKERVSAEPVNLEQFVANLRVIAQRKTADSSEDFNPADWFGGNFDDAYFGGVEDGFSAMAADVLPELETLLVVRQELGVVFQAFKDFGNKHCRRTELNAGYYRPEVGTEFRELYAKLKLLVERV